MTVLEIVFLVSSFTNNKYTNYVLIWSALISMMLSFIAMSVALIGIFI